MLLSPRSRVFLLHQISEPISTHVIQVPKTQRELRENYLPTMTRCALKILESKTARDCLLFLPTQAPIKQSLTFDQL